MPIPPVDFQSPRYHPVGYTEHIEPLSSKGDQEQAAKKAGLPAAWYADTLNGQTVQSGKSQTDLLMEAMSAKSSSSKKSAGWGGKDTLEYQAPVEATHTTEPARSWFGKAFDSMKNMFSGATSTITQTAAHGLDSLHQTLAPYLPYFHPKVMLEGVEQMTKSVWNTITFADKAFKDPKVNSVEIPELNVDGTHNPFGGRAITRSDYRELQTFQSDVNELLDRLLEMQGDGTDCEALVMALMKAMAENKKEDFELLSQKLTQNYKDRGIESKHRLDETQKLIKKIQANKWYDWFFEATQYTTMAFGAIALTAAGVSQGWPLVLLVIAGVGFANMAGGHVIEKSLGAVTAKATSIVTGNDYAKTHTRHTDRFKIAYTLAMTASGLAIGMWQGSGQVLMKVVMALSGITKQVGTFRQASLKHSSNKAQGEIEYRGSVLEEKEKGIGTGIKELSTAYSSYTRMWDMMKGWMEKQGQEAITLFRNS